MQNSLTAVTVRTRASKACCYPATRMLCYLDHNREETQDDIRVMTDVSNTRRKISESSSLLMSRFNCSAEELYVPEIALLGVDEADGGVLFVGVGGDKVVTLTGEVFKLHTHGHRVDVCVAGRRHGALDDFICFPTK